MPLFDGLLENRPVDPSEEFARQHNHFFMARKLEAFDPRSASGRIRWEGFSLEQRVSYHQVTLPFADQKAWTDVPPSEYEDVQDLPFSISFITPRTVRLRLAARPHVWSVRCRKEGLDVFGGSMQNSSLPKSPLLSNSVNSVS